MRVGIEHVVLDERCQARASLSQEVVQEYAERYREGVDMPAVDVWAVGGLYYLVDGFHRVAAMTLAGESFASVQVVGSGTIDDAVWRAMAANATHGLRRSSEDKRRAVAIACNSGIGQEQSSREIAAHVGVSHWLVQQCRAEWEEERQRLREPSHAPGRTSTGREPSHASGNVSTGREETHARGHMDSAEPRTPEPATRPHAALDDDEREQRVEAVEPAVGSLIAIALEELEGHRMRIIVGLPPRSPHRRTIADGFDMLARRLREALA